MFSEDHFYCNPVVFLSKCGSCTCISNFYCWSLKKGYWPYTLVFFHLLQLFSVPILMAIFPGRPGLSNTRMSPFWILLELMMIEVVVETGAIRQWNCHQQQTSRFYRPMPSCQTNSVRALNEKFTAVFDN